MLPSSMIMTFFNFLILMKIYREKKEEKKKKKSELCRIRQINLDPQRCII